MGTFWGLLNNSVRKGSPLLILILPLFLKAQDRRTPWTTMGVIGDSATTGAISNPQLQLSFDNLGLHIAETLIKLGGSNLSKNPFWRAQPAELSQVPDNDFFGLQDLNPPRRAWWTNSSLEQAGSHIIDYEEYSWPYLLGRKLGIDPNQMYFASRDGEHSTGFDDQVEALMKLTGQEIPELLFVHFTGNDLCNESLFKESDDETFQRIFKGYKMGFDRISTVEKNISTQSSEKTKSLILVMPFIDFTQVLSNQEVLKTRVPLNKKNTITCGDFRRRKLKYNLWENVFSKQLVSILYKLCPTISKTDLNDDQKIKYLKHKVEIARKAQRESTQYASLNLKSKVHYLNPMETFSLRENEIAHDCFHLGIRANARLARELYESYFLKE